MADAPSSMSRARDGYFSIVDSTVGEHPRIAAALIIVLAIMVVYFYMQSCSKEHYHSGGGYGQHHGLRLTAGDAGWGGPMHSITHEGSTRPYAHSAEGPHKPRLVPSELDCGGYTPASDYCVSCDIEEMTVGQAGGDDDELRAALEGR